MKHLLVNAICLMTIVILWPVGSSSLCGDYKPFKDEKCYGFDTRVASYEDAKKFCNQNEGLDVKWTLLKITSQEEHDFISNFYFKEKKVVDNIWIGAKDVGNNKFKWEDGYDLEYTNWAPGYPQAIANSCVQMHFDKDLLGKWVNVPCLQSAKFQCQSFQTWSSQVIQKVLLENRKALLKTEQNLVETKKHLSKVEQNPVPIGFIYVQMPREKSPSEIWPWMTWDDISSSYAGVFFRAEGGSSKKFGEIQDENTPRIDKTVFKLVESEGFKGTNDIFDIPKEGWSGWLWKAYDSSFSGTFITRYHSSGGENVPRNMAIRIWKRKA